MDDGLTELEILLAMDERPERMALLLAQASPEVLRRVRAHLGTIATAIDEVLGEAPRGRRRMKTGS